MLRKAPFTILLIISCIIVGYGYCYYQMSLTDDSSDEVYPAASDQTSDVAENDEPQRPPAVTNFISYEPVPTDSPYYSDPGCYALTTAADFVSVDNDYFANSCWIGDSRTIGIYDYSGWENVDFYCENGYCAYYFTKEKELICQNTREKMTLQNALSLKSYGKVYIMLGINDCGYGNTEKFQERYRSLIAYIRETQPNAIIYLCANLRVSESKEDEVINNIDINDKNVAIAQLADGVYTYYLDYNSLFVDENGYLRAEVSFDGAHLYAEYYKQLAQYFMEHAVE